MAEGERLVEVRQAGSRGVRLLAPLWGLFLSRNLCL
jgi:hypothetical protein